MEQSQDVTCRDYSSISHASIVQPVHNWSGQVGSAGVSVLMVDSLEKFFSFSRRVYHFEFLSLLIGLTVALIIML